MLIPDTGVVLACESLEVFPDDIGVSLDRKVRLAICVFVPNSNYIKRINICYVIPVLGLRLCCLVTLLLHHLHYSKLIPKCACPNQFKRDNSDHPGPAKYREHGITASRKVLL